ncbi:MAG TPA: LuxR C-terminal-related transcriptional regulator [Acidimicrobiales bacterium]|nr:LuxR C-terminal-related transcriptional regulator [Acidimicrobiales bacterium]
MGLRGELPGQITSFIGRASTLELTRQLLAEHRLVSLIGPGGCGKTRLAIEVARRTGPCTVCFVDLSGLSDPGLVPGAVASALGLAEIPGKEPLASLADQLLDRELLVLLDNCEHLVGTCADLADVLLRHCPGVRLLPTSRERLGLPGETVVTVGGLELPKGSGVVSVRSLERSEAGRLFVERARAARPGLSLDEDDVRAVVAICERLDGIPLALELAAARVSMLSVGAIVERLSDWSGLLGRTGRTGPPRQQSLLASIEWSCNLLSHKERLLLYRLSIFASGFGLGAAEVVGSGGEVRSDEVFELLASLVEKSLVEASPEAERFRLHETVRAYAAARLEAQGATAAARDRHLGYFIGLAKAVAPTFWISGPAGSWRTLQADLDNVRAALDWAAESKQIDPGSEIMGAAGELFYARCLRTEAARRCQEMLAADLAPGRQAAALAWASLCSENLDPATSLQLAEELTAQGRSLGDLTMVARGLVNEAYAYSLGNPRRAVTLLDKALPLARSLRQDDLIVHGLVCQCVTYKWFARPREAVAFAEEALQVAERAGWEWGVMRARAALALAAVWAGQLQRALQEAEIVTSYGEERSYPLLAVLGGIVLSEVAYHQGDQGAAAAAERARVTALASGDLFNAASTEVVKGRALISLGQVHEGDELVERAYTKLEAFGLAQAHVDVLADLVEIALRQGDKAVARRHLAACNSRTSGADEPLVSLARRAGARLARADGEFSRANTLACDGLRLAYGGGGLLHVIDLLELVAIGLVDLGRPTEAARLLGAAESQRDLIGYVRSVPARDEMAPVIAGAQEALGQDDFDLTVAEGRALALGEAIGYALRGRGNRTRASSGWDSLTPSERRVASLVGQHLSNAEIAERLFISIPTVKSHLSRTFAKLGVANRGQLAGVAHQRAARAEDHGSFSVTMRAPLAASARGFRGRKER